MERQRDKNGRFLKREEVQETKINKEELKLNIMENNNQVSIVKYGISILILSIIAFICIEFKQVKGGQLGVMETWTDGVVNQVYQPKNYWLFPGFSKEIYTYPVTLQRTVLSDYEIKSSDNQQMTVQSYVQWRRDPAKLVHHHTTLKMNAEEIAIKPAMQGAILSHGTQFKAIDAYSGEGLNRMRLEIEKDLRTNATFADAGIIIESFVIEYNHLREEYVKEITQRQLATLRQTRAIEEQKAAEAEALVAKSKAQADLNIQVVAAERDQQVKIIAAKAQSEQTIIAAKAAQEQTVIAAKGESEKLRVEAEGELAAAKMKAEGLLALGKSQAESQKLQLQAYAVPGSETYARTKIAESLASAFANIKGYLPSDMKVNLLTDSFNKSVDILTGNIVVPAK